MIKAFILALQFLTRLPINIGVDVERNTIAKGAVYFPFIGMIIGSISAVTYYALGFVNRDIAALCAVFAIIAVTGGLHLDGLSDTADGFFSSRSRERILEIMKDSRVGTFGVAAIVFDLLFKYVIIKDLDPKIAVIAIILSCGAGRVSTASLFTFGKTARPGGMGDLFTGNKTKSFYFAGLLLFGAAGYLIGGNLFLISMSAVLIFTFIFMKYCYKVIGGLTGDTYGAACEISEIISLFAFLMVGRWI